MTAKKIHIMMFLLLFFLLIGEPWAMDWGFRGLLPRGTGYYDKSSIKKINKSIAQVWTVTVYNEKGKEDAFSILKKQNKEPRDSKILNQESTLLEFDCVKNTFRIVAFNIYDENETILLSAPDIHAEWRDIIPGSVNEKLKIIVCPSGETSKKDLK